MIPAAWLSSVIRSHGYAALLLATVLEGPVATVVGAFMAWRGALDVGLVYVVAVIGDLAGDLIYYGAGRWGRNTLRFPRLSERRAAWLAVLERDFRARTRHVLLVGKLTHSAGMLVLLAAGAARIPLATFLRYNLLGALPKTALLVVLGYFAGAAVRIDSIAALASVLGLPLACIVLGLYLRGRPCDHARS